MTHLPCPHRKGGSGPQRSLSVEDIGAPGQLRAVGRVVEVFPDGTSQLELQRPPHGAFGFSVTSGHGRPDTGTEGSSQSLVPPQGTNGGATQPTPKAVCARFVSVQLPRGQGGLSPMPAPSAGVYVQEMADAGTAKLYAGLLGVGDEILQVNGAAVSGLGLARIRQLLLQADTLTLRVLRHRPAPR